MRYLKLFEEMDPKKGKLEDSPNSPKLAYTIKTIVEVDWHSFEKFVMEVYDIEDYSLDEFHDVNNGAVLRFSVNGRMSERNIKSIQNFMEGDFSDIDTHTILDDLARKGYIPTGTYHIRCSW